MLLSDALCFIFLTISITATCVGAEGTKQELMERRPARRTKREAIIITGYPTNAYKINNSNQRASKLRYWNKKPKRGSLKPMYGPPPPIPNRVSVKKYKKKQLRSKYNKYNSKRNAQPKYPSMKPYYGRPPPPKVSRPQPYYPQEPAGFGEPPKEIAQEYVQPPKQTYGEPPVDSYGNPLNQNFPTGLSPFENHNPNTAFDQQQYQSLQSYHQDANIDNNNAYSKHHPVYSKPEIEEYDHEEPHKYTQIKFDSYADVYKQHPINDYQHTKPKNKHQDLPIIKKYKSWKGNQKANDYDSQDHNNMIVGGKYAEPPGRLMPSYHHEAPQYQVEDVAQDSYIESALASSSSMSPYINYKHSNMAFSPQNLNDAFSPFIN